MKRKKIIKPIIAIGYLLSIVLGVWAIGAIGIVPVGFGLMAPAAVYFVGITLVLRDLVQEVYGKWVSLGLILVATAISVLISPSLAIASGTAFLISELIDLAIYSKVRAKGILAAILVSNAFSIVVDSLIFLSLAFGSLAFLPGQILGKAIATIVAVLILAIIKGSNEVLSRNP